MPVKQFNANSLGIVNVYKRRGSKRITMRVNGSNVKVIQPYWMPYVVGYNFALKNSQWIRAQISKSNEFFIHDNMSVGKMHTLYFVKNSNKLSTRIVDTKANVYLPSNMPITNAKAQNAAKSVIKRTLAKEAKQLLPIRVKTIANNTNTTISNLSLKAMRSRWGSCTSNKKVTLNIYLLMCDYSLIDYVILHELAHTKHLNHSKDFWAFVESYMPDYKIRRKKLKEIQSSVLNLQA